MSALLQVGDAHVAYGKVEAVRVVSLEVADNEIVTIIGANGAGKTTLLNAIMGILPLRGAAAFAGAVMAPLDIEDRVAAGLSLVPEHRELFSTMNVEDNLQLGAFRDLPPHTHENVSHGVHEQAEGMPCTLAPARRERRDIHSLRVKPRVLFGNREICFAGREGLPYSRPCRADELACGRAILGRDILHARIEQREWGCLPRVAGAGRPELAHGGGGVDGCERGIRGCGYRRCGDLSVF